MQNTKMDNALHWLPLNTLYVKMGYKKRYKVSFRHVQCSEDCKVRLLSVLDPCGYFAAL